MKRAIFTLLAMSSLCMLSYAQEGITKEERTSVLATITTLSLAHRHQDLKKFIADTTYVKMSISSADIIPLIKQLKSSAAIRGCVGLVLAGGSGSLGYYLIRKNYHIIDSTDTRNKPIAIWVQEHPARDTDLIIRQLTPQKTTRYVSYIKNRKMLSLGIISALTSCCISATTLYDAYATYLTVRVLEELNENLSRIFN